MSKKFKKFKNPQFKKTSKKISHNEIKNMISGFTDEEFEFVAERTAKTNANNLFNN